MRHQRFGSSLIKVSGGSGGDTVGPEVGILLFHH